MSIPADLVNDDGTLRELTAEEKAAIELATADVRDGTHPTWRLDSSGSTCTRHWFFRGKRSPVFPKPGTTDPWTQKDLQDYALYELLGAVKTYTDGDGRLQLSRKNPSFIPGSPNYIALAVENLTGARGVGKDDDRQLPEYPWRKATVRHELVFFDVLSDLSALAGGGEADRNVQVLPSSAEVTYLTLHGGMLNYVRSEGAGLPHGAAIPFSIGRPEVQTKFSLKWWRLPRAAWGPGTDLHKKIKGSVADGITAMAGTVNRTTFKGRDPGTVLFLGVDEEIIADPVAEDYAWNLTYHFLEKTQGHNRLWYGGTNVIDSGTKGYYRVSTGLTYEPDGEVTDGTSLFNESELNDLFKVGL